MTVLKPNCHPIRPVTPDKAAWVTIYGDVVMFSSAGPRGGSTFYTVDADALLEAAALLLASREDHRCVACLRPEADCSASPCPAVIEDRES